MNNCLGHNRCVARKETLFQVLKVDSYGAKDSGYLHMYPIFFSLFPDSEAVTQCFVKEQLPRTGIEFHNRYGLEGVIGIWSVSFGKAKVYFFFMYIINIYFI